MAMMMTIRKEIREIRETRETRETKETKEIKTKKTRKTRKTKRIRKKNPKKNAKIEVPNAATGLKKRARKCAKEKESGGSVRTPVEDVKFCTLVTERFNSVNSFNFE